MFLVNSRDGQSENRANHSSNFHINRLFQLFINGKDVIRAMNRLHRGIFFRLLSKVCSLNPNLSQTTNLIKMDIYSKYLGIVVDVLVVFLLLDAYLIHKGAVIPQQPDLVWIGVLQSCYYTVNRTHTFNHTNDHNPLFHTIDISQIFERNLNCMDDFDAGLLGVRVDFFNHIAEGAIFKIFTEFL